MTASTTSERLYTPTARKIHSFCFCHVLGADMSRSPRLQSGRRAFGPAAASSTGQKASARTKATINVTQSPGIQQNALSTYWVLNSSTSYAQAMHGSGISSENRLYQPPSLAGPPTTTPSLAILGLDFARLPKDLGHYFPLASNLRATNAPSTDSSLCLVWCGR